MLRLAICQQIIPAYRMPVFNLLGAQEGLELTVFAGRLTASVGTSDEDRTHFEHVVSEPVPCRWPPGPFWHQPGQLEAIDPDRFDLVILSWNAWSRSLPVAMRRARRQRLPVALWGHGYSKQPSPIRDYLRNRLGHRADAVMVYSRAVADRLIADDGYDRNRMFVAPNAIDQAPVQAACRSWGERPEALAAFQAEHGLDPGQTVVFVSRLLRENRPDLLIDGLARLRRDRPHARLVIVGDGPERAALESHARQLGQTDAVTFTGAIFGDEELAPWMLSSTLFCYPVNIGLSLLHGFGYGLPAVTSDDMASHNPEIEAFAAGKNGLLYRDGDLDDLAATWAKIMDDPTRRDEMGRCAERTVRETYSLANMVQGFLDLASIVDVLERREKV